jgi:hypothetical protein
MIVIYSSSLISTFKAAEKAIEKLEKDHSSEIKNVSEYKSLKAAENAIKKFSETEKVAKQDLSSNSHSHDYTSCILDEKDPSLKNVFDNFQVLPVLVHLTPEL